MKKLTIELKKINGQYAIYVNGKESNINCYQCKYYNGEEKDCKMSSKVPDERIYPFCGAVCGYFEFNW